MKEYFKQQIDDGNPITEDTIGKLKSKFYSNNDPILVGDIILFAFLKEEKKARGPDYELISLNERHFNEYDVDIKHSFPVETVIPKIVKKQKNND